MNRKKSRRKSRKYSRRKAMKRGGTRIASGSSGCVFFPALPCDADTPPNMVTKLMSKVDGTREYEKLNKIKARIETIPDYRAYFVLDVTLCIPTAPLNVECPVLEKKGIDHSKMVALNMPHGGISVSDFLREDVDIAKLHIVHRGLVKLLRNGIVELNRRNVYHGDVKDTNILVDTSTLRLIDWGLSAEYDPRARLQIPFLTNNLPNVWRNRPLIFNVPFSIILFSDEFSIKYPRFIQENGGDDFTPTAEVLAPFVKDYVNAGKGRGHYEMICQIVRFLFGHVIKETESTDESLTDEFIVEYLVVVLLNFTAFDGVFINFKRYVDSVFTQLVDVWGLIMSYYPILGILSQTPDSKAFKQLQFIFVEYLYNARHEPIDMDDLCKDLDIFGKLLEK